MLFAGKVRMKSISLKLLAAAIGLAPVAGLPMLSGCSVHEHVSAYPYHEGVYAYDPGYYYDREYYDDVGHFHPRHYYYYDGHHWDDREGVPSGFQARERREEHREHARHEIHEEHHDHD